MWTLCLLLKKIKNKDKLKLFGILAPALKHRHTQKTGCNRQHQQILTFLKVFKGNLKPKTYTFNLSMSHTWSFYRTNTFKYIGYCSGYTFSALTWQFTATPHRQLHFIDTHLPTHSAACSTTTHHQWDD